MKEGIQLIIWTKEVPTEDKKKIEEFIKPFSSNDFEVLNNLPKSDFDGGFSDIYFVGDYTLKRTGFWDYDDLSDEKLECDLTLQSDHKVMLVLKDLPLIPYLYGYSEDGDWVIMETMQNSSLEDILLTGEELDPILEKTCIDFLSSVIEKGLYPHDFRFRCVYPEEENGIKVIDFNMYQEISELKELDAQLDFSLSSEEMAIEFWLKLKNMELKIIDGNKKVLGFR